MLATKVITPVTAAAAAKTQNIAVIVFSWIAPIRVCMTCPFQEQMLGACETQHPVDRCSGEEVVCQNARIWRYCKAVRPKTRFIICKSRPLELQASLLCNNDNEINTMYSRLDIQKNRSRIARGRYGLYGDLAGLIRGRLHTIPYCPMVFVRSIAGRMGRITLG
jgi:hypothetical protein